MNTEQLHDELTEQENFDDVSREPYLIIEKVGDLAVRYSEWAERRPYAATAVETIGVYVARRTISAMGKRHGLNLGNALTTNGKAVEQAMERPLVYGAIQTVAAPIVEEFGARVIPGMLANAQARKGRKRVAQSIRHAVDIGFAAWHAGFVVPEIAESSLKPTIRFRQEGDNMSLPVSQYLAGRNLRRIYETRGYGPAVFSHALNNTIAAATGYVQYRNSDK